MRPPPRRRQKTDNFPLPFPSPSILGGCERPKSTCEGSRVFRERTRKKTRSLTFFFFSLASSPPSPRPPPELIVVSLSVAGRLASPPRKTCEEPARLAFFGVNEVPGRHDRTDGISYAGGLRMPVRAQSRGRRSDGFTTACRGRGTSDILMSDADAVPRECVILALSGNYDLDGTHRGSREGRSRWRRGRTDGWGGLVGAVGWERDVVVGSLRQWRKMRIHHPNPAGAR